MRLGWVSLAAVALAALPTTVAAQGGPARAPQGPADEEADRLLNEVGLLAKKGKFAQALELAERAVVVMENAHGKDHLAVAKPLSTLAILLRLQGAFERSRAAYERLVRIQEQARGKHHPDVAAALDRLASVHSELGAHELALPLYERALAIRRSALGDSHPDVASTLDHLAGLHHAQGDLNKAASIYQQVLRMREAALGKSHPEVASTLDRMATVARSQGKYAAALRLAQRALRLAEGAQGAKPVLLATYVSNLAEHYRTIGDYERAESLGWRAVRELEKFFGKEHRAVAASLGNLAGLYADKGDLPKAIELQQRALGIHRRSLGEKHPRVAIATGNLAVLWAKRGAYDRAIELAQQALEIDERTYGSDHLRVATSLNNLASLHHDNKDYERAEQLYQRVLDICEKHLGADHAELATTLNNLAMLHLDRGRYGPAGSLLRRARDIRTKALGTKHPLVATTLHNLGVLELEQHRYPRAEPLLEQALAIRVYALGESHPSVADNLISLSMLRAAQGKATEAITLLGRANASRERTSQAMLTSGAVAQRQAYFATLNRETDWTIDLAVQTAPQSQAGARLALTTVLQRKGRVLDAAADTLRVLRRSAEARDRNLLDELAAVRAALASRVLSGPSETSPAEHRNAIAQLRQRTDDLETRLGARYAALRDQRQSIRIEAVQRALPPDASLVEITSYRPMRRSAASAAERWGEPRYVAYVLQRSGPVKWTVLGEAAPIDALVRQLREMLETGGFGYAAVARALDRRVMEPIRSLLGESRDVLISPDGQLNLIPFAALVDEHDRFLVSQYRFTYLTSGRELLRHGGGSPPRQPPLVLAHPRYGASGAAGRNGEQDRSSHHSRARRGLRFMALPGTAAEAKALASMLPKAVLLTGAQATEAALKRVAGPQVLHIATHGFFLSDLGSAVESPNTRGLTLQLNPTSAQGARRLPDNPLLRSGLALAGANEHLSGGQDGILTAMEMAHLDLQGTQLVVLSACETGLGEVRNGEGVYGLRRALTLAGAQTQVMSLWKVDDDSTAAVMRAYYRQLLSGDGRSDGLRNVQLTMLARPETAHPKHWAAFIVSGDGRSLEGDPAPPVRVSSAGSDASALLEAQPSARGCACRLPAPAGRRSRKGSVGTVAWLLWLAGWSRRRRDLARTMLAFFRPLRRRHASVRSS